VFSYLRDTRATLSKPNPHPTPLPRRAKSDDVLRSARDIEDDG